MATAVPTPRLPSMLEIEKIMRERLPGLSVYNPSPSWIQLNVFGLTHLWVAPDLGGAVEPHPVTGVPTICNGVTSVRGRFLTQKDSSGKVIEGQDAPAMVKFLVSPENYGQMGMVWLPGENPEQDEKLKELSRAVYSKYQEHEDEEIVAKRAEFKANWVKGPRKAEPCPPPTPKETAAMDRLQMRKRKADYLYTCDVPDCPGYAVNEWGRFEAHMKAAHNIVVKKSQYESGKEVQGISPAPLAEQPAEPAPEPRAAIEVAAERMQAQIEQEGEEEPDVPRRRRVNK